MSAKFIQALLRKVAGLLSLITAIYGFATFIIFIAWFLYDHAFLNTKTLIGAGLYFIVSLFLLLISDKLLHAKKEM